MILQQTITGSISITTGETVGWGKTIIICLGDYGDMQSLQL